VRYQGSLVHYKYFRKFAPALKIEYNPTQLNYNIKSTKNNIQADINTLNHDQHDTL
jgi:hypothetical protein